MCFGLHNNTQSPEDSLYYILVFLEMRKVDNYLCSAIHNFDHLFVTHSGKVKSTLTVFSPNIYSKTRKSFLSGILKLYNLSPFFCRYLLIYI